MQLHVHLQLVLCTRVLRLCAADLVRHASDSLDVVGIFMRHHIEAREIAALARHLRKLIVKRHVDIHCVDIYCLVRRTVERPPADRARPTTGGELLSRGKAQRWLAETIAKPGFVKPGLPRLVQ